MSSAREEAVVFVILNAYDLWHKPTNHFSQHLHSVTAKFEMGSTVDNVPKHIPPCSSLVQGMLN
jgi:hypothetical protein